ncbi:MAG: hypothetical protein J6V37_02910, partial [Clostridia bacterium]|nr:hypothetical protein [Clostridia bacterium]
GTHSRVCANNDTHTETDDCVGEDATCLGDSNCTICGGIYQTAPDHTDEDQDGVCDDCETEVDDDPNYRGDDDCEHLNETVVTIPATCLAPGSIEHTCPDCGSVRIQPIEPLAHSWTDWESNGDGTHSRVCINGDTHTETEDCVGEDATCTEDSKCTVCDGIYQNATGHKDEDDNGTCDVCGAQISSEDTEPNPDGGTCDHTYDDGEVLVEASCEEEGEVLYTCTKCGDSYSLTLIPLGHKDGDSDGLCDDCGADLENGDDNTDDVCTHDYNSVTNIEAGCESFGEVLHTCTKCGDSYTENVDPLGHVDNDTEWPDYHCDRITENGEPCGASTCEEHIFSRYGHMHVPGTRHDGQECLNCKLLIPKSDCQVEYVEWQPTCTLYGYSGDACTTYDEYALLEDGLIAPSGHYDNDLDGLCDSCGMEMEQVGDCLHTNYHYDYSTDYGYELVNVERVLVKTINGLEYHWKVCDDCSMIFDLSEHTFDTLTTVPPCYYNVGYDVYACICGAEDEATKTNLIFGGGTYRNGHPDADGDYYCDNCETFIEANHTCVDENDNNHCDHCDDCRCEFTDNIYEMDLDGDHWCDNCYDRLNTCTDEDNDGFCDNEMECGKHLECVDADGDYYCDGCGSGRYIEHEHTDGDNDAYCDICRYHEFHIDEDSDCWCDNCWDSLCVDSDNNCACDNCGEMEDIWSNRFHRDDNHDHRCDKCGTE